MENRKKIKKTSTITSSFGAPGRINHDSTQFYSSRLYEGLESGKKVKFIENLIPEQNLNMLYCKSSEQMDELPDNSIHLMITSPPYVVTKECDQELKLSEYITILNNVWRETYRVLVPGGRACIDIGIIDRKPYIPLHIYIIEGMQNLGFLMRGEIIWNKASNSSFQHWGTIAFLQPILFFKMHMNIFWFFQRIVFQEKVKIKRILFQKKTF